MGFLDCGSRFHPSISSPVLLWLLSDVPQAASDAGKHLKVYAVEKNPNAVVTLHVSPWQLPLSHLAPVCLLVTVLYNDMAFFVWLHG